MSKLIKKYALVSTSFWGGDNWKSFAILKDGLTEDDLIKIKSDADIHRQLWNQCYKQEQENVKNGVSEDLRTDLNKLINQRTPENGYQSIKDNHKLWLDKDLIIESFHVE